MSSQRLVLVYESAVVLILALLSGLQWGFVLFVIARESFGLPLGISRIVGCVSFAGTMLFFAIKLITGQRLALVYRSALVFMIAVASGLLWGGAPFIVAYKLFCLSLDTSRIVYLASFAGTLLFFAIMRKAMMESLDVDLQRERWRKRQEKKAQERSSVK